METIGGGERGTADEGAPPGEPSGAVRGRVAEVARVFLELGCRSFGGPVAHLAYFRAELVERRKWLDDAHFSDTVALCQFLPGPASSQVVFAVGMQRAGLLGAVVASACFTLPSVILMVAFAYGVSSARDLRDAGWLHGLGVAAVAVVAQAVWGMGKKLCPDRIRIVLCLASACALWAYPGALSQIVVLVVGALVGYAAYRDGSAKDIPSEPVAEPPPAPSARGTRAGVLALVALVVLLVGLPIAAAASPTQVVGVAAAFVRAGALVFGGGHVVLPLLRAEIVPRGWLTDERFFAGYGAAQAIPGPMFTFAAYLGAAMAPGPWAWAAGLGCTLAIFLPAWLLVGGVLPFWQRLRSTRAAQAALAGANASVVGVLLAALYNPVFKEGIRTKADIAAALVAFALLETWKVSPLVVVVGMAVVGQVILR